MADATTTPGVAPGTGTSEFKVTIISTILSIVVTVVGIASNFIDAIQQAGVTGKWVTIATTVIGVLGMVLTALGYQVTRSNVKAAAVAASGAVPVVTPAQAADTLSK